MKLIYGLSIFAASAVIVASVSQAQVGRPGRVDNASTHTFHLVSAGNFTLRYDSSSGQTQVEQTSGLGYTYTAVKEYGTAMPEGSAGRYEVTGSGVTFRRIDTLTGKTWHTHTNGGVLVWDAE